MVIEEVHKWNACVEESKYNVGCLLGIFDPKAPSSQKTKMAMNNGRIQLQQDGAKSHILDDDEEFKEAVDDIGLNLTVYTQLPNSPDTNILDLGFFRAIQLFNNDCPATEEELIKSVEKAYGEYPMRKLNHVCLQSC